jgi:enoyl-CoA hydratase
MELTDTLYEVDNGLAWITINRPERLNAFRARTIDELIDSFTRSWADPAVGVVCLTGAGDRAFCAGGDQKQRAETGDYGPSATGLFEVERLHRLIRDIPKPVIAAVNGFALGGGCETAMACTIRIAAETARFGQPEVKLGLLPGGGGTQRLPRLVGKGRALQLILSGGTIDAAEAWRIGLVNEVVPAAGLIARAEAILAEIFANAPIAVSYALEAVNRGLDGDQAEGLALEAALFGVCAGTADKAEGAAAFLEKRKPAFAGR